MQEFDKKTKVIEKCRATKYKLDGFDLVQPSLNLWTTWFFAGGWNDEANRIKSN